MYHRDGKNPFVLILEESSMLLSVLTSVALAFAPSQTTWIGVEPNRMYEFNRVTQDRLRNQQYWSDFTTAYPTWQARFDEASGKPYRMWGAGIDLTQHLKQPSIQSCCHFYRMHTPHRFEG